MEETGFANCDELNMRTQSSSNAFTILEAQQRNAVKSSRPAGHAKYLKKSTVFIILAFAVNVAALMCIGSGVLVYLVTAGDRECKLILPESYIISENQDKVSTTSKNVLPKSMSPRVSPDVSTKGILTSDNTTTEASKIAITSKTPSLPIKQTKTTQEKTAQTKGDLTTTSAVSVESTTVGGQAVNMTLCPNGWVAYSSSCYLFARNSERMFKKAENYCRQFGGYLVQLETMEENLFVRNYLRGLKEELHWLGLTDENIENEWRWNTINTTVTFSGCPSNWLTYGQSCYFFSNQSVTWLDAMVRCQTLGGYLAEIGTAAENQFLKTHAKQIDNIECFQTTSIEYQGVRNTTYDGHECQRWDSQKPHSHTRNSTKHFPERRLADVANYCRDPDREGVLWCYTTDPDKRWQYCDIHKCPGGNWWLGLVILEGKWKWMNRKTEFDNDYTNWGPAEPSNGKCGSFMAALDFAWNRENCNVPLMYLCEK